MQYHILWRGRNKTNLKPVMIDEAKKVENYKKALESSDKGTGKTWHYSVTPAENDAKIWRKNNSNKWTNYDSSNPPLTRNGSRG